MSVYGSNRSAKQFGRRVLELIALHRRTLTKWSVTVEQFTLSPLPRHLKINVIHDVCFRGARPAFIWGNQAVDGRREEMPFRLVKRVRRRLGAWIRDQRRGLSCRQRHGGNRD